MSSVILIPARLNVKFSTTDSMDIQLIDVIDKIFVVPQSILGVLWLQLKFDPDHWDDLTNGAVVLQRHDAASLVIDAEDGGLIVKHN